MGFGAQRDADNVSEDRFDASRKIASAGKQSILRTLARVPSGRMSDVNRLRTLSGAGFHCASVVEAPETSKKANVA